MECPCCKKEMGTVGVFSTLTVGRYVKDDESGKYVQDDTDETYSEEQYCCGECGEPLQKDALAEFLKLTEDAENGDGE